MSEVLKRRIEYRKERILKLLNEIIDIEYEMYVRQFRSFYTTERNIGTEEKPKMITLKFGVITKYMRSKYPDVFEEMKNQKEICIEYNGKRCTHKGMVTYFTEDDIKF